MTEVGLSFRLTLFKITSFSWLLVTTRLYGDRISTCTLSLAFILKQIIPQNHKLFLSSVTQNISPVIFVEESVVVIKFQYAFVQHCSVDLIRICRVVQTTFSIQTYYMGWLQYLYLFLLIRRGFIFHKLYLLFYFLKLIITLKSFYFNMFRLFRV